MTIAERLYRIVDRLPEEQQVVLLQIAEKMAHPNNLTRDQLLALPLEERVHLLESVLAPASLDEYEYFEANDPIYDYDGNADHSAR
jgi:hypothetical protein